MRLHEGPVTLFYCKYKCRESRMSAKIIGDEIRVVNSPSPLCVLNIAGLLEEEIHHRQTQHAQASPEQIGKQVRKSARHKEAIGA